MQIQGGLRTWSWLLDSEKPGGLGNSPRGALSLSVKSTCQDRPMSNCSYSQYGIHTRCMSLLMAWWGCTGTLGRRSNAATKGLWSEVETDGTEAYILLSKQPTAAARTGGVSGESDGASRGLTLLDPTRLDQPSSGSCISLCMRVRARATHGAIDFQRMRCSFT